MFTIGYGGRSPEAFRDDLVMNGIGRLVDVRQMPRSRKPGFSKGSLYRHLSESGIDYMHLGELGSPKATREDLETTGDLDFFFKSYRQHLAKVEASVDLLARFAREKPTAIMCLERDPARCHRSVIAEKMRELGFEVRDL